MSHHVLCTKRTLRASTVVEPLRTSFVIYFPATSLLPQQKLFVFGTTFACVYVPGFVLSIQNGIPDSTIKVHCKAKDTDIGEHYLSYNQEFHWRFCETYFHHTLYFCHFYWGSQEQVFDVFNTTMMYTCNKDKGDNNPCDWLVQSDGFYFYDFDKGSWGKQYDWR
ncbi:hypothetical protein OSB04_027560 [Centaurea solstitialis]|uniref:S-protein homolog n=1 Tax=Centaurea solstitialis TaxID=347529 RepID=A0AA38W8E4_9ASTR|nr:hypothetical protein OSB04_027560 [Centaurea solstitialis]